MTGFRLKELPDNLDVFTQEALENFLDSQIYEQDLTILDVKTDDAGNIFAPIAKDRFKYDTVEEDDYEQILSVKELQNMALKLELINDVAIMNSERD